jgi:lipopolysaccharide transport system ATP-binding protein
MFAIRNLCTKAVVIESGYVSANGDVDDAVEMYLVPVSNHQGEISWAAPHSAPGDDRLRLKAIRVVSDGMATATPDIAKKIGVEIDYWNLEPNGRRLISIHIHNNDGVCVLTSGNLASACVTPDPWLMRPYPRGLFRTSCTLPANLLNDGRHTVGLYINQKSATDNILVMRDVLSFDARDSGEMRKEYTGKWLGAVRPRLDWKTDQLETI